MLNGLKSKFLGDEKKDKTEEEKKNLDIEDLENEIADTKKKEDEGFFGK